MTRIHLQTLYSRVQICGLVPKMIKGVAHFDDDDIVQLVKSHKVGRPKKYAPQSKQVKPD